MRIFGLVSLLAAISHVLAHETPGDLELLLMGNKVFRDNIAITDPGLLQRLADEGQSPPFMFLGCSDSRVSEDTIFNAKPGMVFAAQNIANQFLGADTAVQSVLAYAVASLGVKHIIVMGHYGCGGVAAAIAPPPEAPVDAANGAVQNWIESIRVIFRTSDRPEIVELRNNITDHVDINNPGFRALIEENVKASVHRIAENSVITNHYALLKSSGAGNSTAKRSGTKTPIHAVFIHGWVYNIVNGEIHDLGVSVGPPGMAIPSS